MEGIQYDMPFEDEVQQFLSMVSFEKDMENTNLTEKPRSQMLYGSNSCGHANLNDKFVCRREMELDIVQGVSLDMCSTVKDLEEFPKDFQVHLDLNNGTPNQEESAEAHKRVTIDEIEK